MDRSDPRISLYGYCIAAALREGMPRAPNRVRRACSARAWISAGKPDVMYRHSKRRTGCPTYMKGRPDGIGETIEKYLQTR